jgi:hypothetical protein
MWAGRHCCNDLVKRGCLRRGRRASEVPGRPRRRAHPVERVKSPGALRFSQSASSRFDITFGSPALRRAEEQRQRLGAMALLTTSSANVVAGLVGARVSSGSVQVRVEVCTSPVPDVLEFGAVDLDTDVSVPLGHRLVREPAVLRLVCANCIDSVSIGVGPFGESRSYFRDSIWTTQLHLPKNPSVLVGLEEEPHVLFIPVGLEPTHGWFQRTHVAF